MLFCKKNLTKYKDLKLSLEHICNIPVKYFRDFIDKRCLFGRVPASTCILCCAQTESVLWTKIIFMTGDGVHQEQGIAHQ